MKRQFAPSRWPGNHLALAFLILAGFLTACNRNDDDPVPTPAPDTTGRISRIIRTFDNSDADTLDLEYNTDGSLRKIIRTDYGLFSTITFTQTAPNTVVRQEISAGGNRYAKDSFLFDAQGRKYEEYQYNISRGTYQYLRRFYYRTDGRLDYTEEPTGFGSTARVTRTWQNGDCIKEDNGITAKTLSYHTDKAAQPGDGAMVDDLLLWGRVWLPNTHLLQSEAYPQESPATYEYTWSNGRIQSVTRNDGSRVVTQTFSYSN